MFLWLKPTIHFIETLYSDRINFKSRRHSHNHNFLQFLLSLPAWRWRRRALTFCPLWFWLLFDRFWACFSWLLRLVIIYKKSCMTNSDDKHLTANGIIAVARALTLQMHIVFQTLHHVSTWTLLCFTFPINTCFDRRNWNACRISYDSGKRSYCIPGRSSSNNLKMLKRSWNPSSICMAACTDQETPVLQYLWPRKPSGAWATSRPKFTFGRFGVKNSGRHLWDWRCLY